MKEESEDRGKRQDPLPPQPRGKKMPNKTLGKGEEGC